MTARRTFPVAALLLCALLQACAAHSVVVLRELSDAAPVPASGPAPAGTWTREIPRIAVPPAGVPVAAIVIDDCGESLEQIVPFLGIPIPLSFSVLPYQPGVSETVRVLHAQGRETLVHVPMEPDDPRWLENDWFLRTGMSDGDIAERLDRALAAVPTATGINNHMGSKFCTDRHAMTTVMNHISARGLYYLDSKTSRGSQAAEAAADTGIRFLTRDVFLDNSEDIEQITAQLDELVARARTQGCAVGIGHARTNTAAAIMRYVRDHDSGVAFVPAGRLFDCCRARPAVPGNQSQTQPE